MAGLNKIEGYLIELGISYEELKPDTYLLNDPENGLAQVVVAYDDPIVMIRAKVMSVPDKNREEFFKTLLELNARDVLHGAYGISGQDVVFLDTLEYADMDKGELEASLDAVGLALSQHYAILSKYRTE
jgi:hypothetical protein